MKKFRFPKRIIELGKRLEEEVVCTINIHDFKERLVRSRYGDEIARAYCFSCK